MAQLTLKDRVLTLIDESGSSAVDLSTIKGDDGPRGPQGPAGIVVGETGTIDMSGYATEDWVLGEINRIEIDVDLSNYYTKTETSGLINGNLSQYYTKTETGALVDDELSNYYTKAETKALIPSVEGLATQTYVNNKITEAVGGIDLSDYLPKDGSASMTGRLIIQSGDGLWLDDSGSSANLYMNFDRGNNCAAIYSDGDIAFTTFDKRIIAVATPVEGTDVANKNYVDTAITNAIAALDGSEVPY